MKQLKEKQGKELTKSLDRFYALYREGRKNEKAPISYIDYFKARHFLLNEIEKVRKETAEYVTAKMIGKTQPPRNTRYIDLYAEGRNDRVMQEIEIAQHLLKDLNN